MYLFVALNSFFVLNGHFILHEMFGFDNNANEKVNERKVSDVFAIIICLISVTHNQA